MKRTKEIPYTKEELHELFEYDDGVLKHKLARRRVKVGSAVGHITSQGYLKTTIYGKRYFVHRLLWIMFNSSIDRDLVIDHINKDTLDNRIENLRLVTQQENMQNSKGKGYYFDKRHNTYNARIRINGGRIHLGCFKKEHEARLTYLNAKDKYHKYYRSLNEG